MPPPARDQGPFLREWRRFRGIRMVDLARRLGISQGSLSRFETGARRVNSDLLQKLAVELTPRQQVAELFVFPSGLRSPRFEVREEEVRDLAYIAVELAQVIRYDPEFGQLLDIWLKLTLKQKTLVLSLAKGIAESE
jgi:transcriptional regulator with XRE-family HTH domain